MLDREFSYECTVYEIQTNVAALFDMALRWWDVLICALQWLMFLWMWVSAMDKGLQRFKYPWAFRNDETATISFPPRYRPLFYYMQMSPFLCMICVFALRTQIACALVYVCLLQVDLEFVCDAPVINYTPDDSWRDANARLGTNQNTRRAAELEAAAWRCRNMLIRAMEVFSLCSLVFGIRDLKYTRLLLNSICNVCLMFVLSQKHIEEKVFFFRGW